MIEETFTKSDLMVTLKVEGENGNPPVAGQSYKIFYFDKKGCLAETEWLENFKPDDIYLELESIADDWLTEEVRRENRQFDEASKD